MCVPHLSSYEETLVRGIAAEEQEKQEEEEVASAVAAAAEEAEVLQALKDGETSCTKKRMLMTPKS